VQEGQMLVHGGNCLRIRENGSSSRKSSLQSSF
jgi:hypothetical protein